ncbi:MAG TPA: TIGR00730 family Rossman fold protein [Ktedonobacterales bacterium]
MRKKTPFRRICVFAASRDGSRADYVEAARLLGQELASRGIGVVYGGASAGLMGALADATLAAGGEVTGVMPRNLFTHEVAHTGLTKLHYTSTMHERKALMADLADAFIALPGGFGTFDELFEIITWAQIGIHEKPIGLLDVRDYFAPLRAMVTHAIEEGFVPRQQLNLLLTGKEPTTLLATMARRATNGHAVRVG